MRPVTAGSALIAAAALLVAGCSATHHKITLFTPATIPITTPPTVGTTSPTTAAGQLPTVPDCGAGAYKPSTLLIVCGINTTMATGVAWTSWNPDTAAGVGSVHLTSGGKAVVAPAHLNLRNVKDGSGGPQYTELDVTWIGSSPDGHPADSFQLGGGSG